MPSPGSNSVDEPDPAAHELKLALPNQRAGAICAWLAGRCLPDPEYPHGLVSSVYFESRDLRTVREKINSDYSKRKFRLRWYSDPATGVPVGPAFLERKQKTGGKRRKTRVATPFEAATVVERDFQSPAWRDALSLLRDARTWVPTDLRPLLEIRFDRRRFVEPATGARISVDRDIRAPRVNPAMLPRSNPAPLVHAVVEVKGARPTLPAWLSPMQRLGCRRASFSKYERCFRKIHRRSSF